MCEMKNIGDKRYFVSRMHNPSQYEELPDAIRCAVYNGCLIFFDEKDNPTNGYAVGQWCEFFLADPAYIEEEDDYGGTISGSR